MMRPYSRSRLFQMSGLLLAAVLSGRPLLAATTRPLIWPTPPSDSTVRSATPREIPIAAIKAGLEAAVALNEMFGRKPNDQAKIRKQLEVLQQQNAQIISQLTEVLDILRNLGVTIRVGVKEQLDAAIRNDLGGVLRTAAEIRLGETSRRSYAQATDRHEIEVLVPLRRLRQNLIDPQVYGYAHFALLGNAMMVELWTSRRVWETAELRRERARSYLTFFDRVLSPAEPGSVAAELASANAQAARMDAILAAADSFVRTTPDSYIERNRVVALVWCNSITHADVQRHVSGNSTDGFRFTDRLVNQRTEAHWVRSCDGGGPTHNKLMSDAKRVTDAEAFGLVQDPTLVQPPDPVLQDQSPASRVTYWNNAIQTRKTARDAAESLEIAYRTAEIYRARAAEDVNDPWD